MKNVLKELEETLNKHNWPIIKKFNDGKNGDEIIDLLNNIKIPILPDMVELYEWKNGIKGVYESRNGQIELFTNGIMFPLEYAISTYLLEAKTSKLFDKHFFPLFTSGGGDYILIDSSKKSQSFNQLFLYSPSVLFSEKPMSIYDSLISLFETVLELYKSGAYSFSDEMLKINYELENELSRKLNPKSVFWIES